MLHALPNAIFFEFRPAVVACFKTQLRPDIMSGISYLADKGFFVVANRRRLSPNSDYDQILFEHAIARLTCNSMRQT